MDVDGPERLPVHVDVPHLERQVVAREDVPPVVAKPHIRDGRDDLGEERLGRRVLWFLVDCRPHQIASVVSRRNRVSTRSHVQRSASGLSVPLACWSHNALARMSQSLMVPLLLL